jgi:hypothetical protein
MSGTVVVLPQFGTGPELPLVFRWLGIGPGHFLHDDGYWVAMITLTPEKAKLLLAPEVAHSNRERSATFANRFADDMSARMWSPYCSAIECAGAVVVDGQTRSEGVVISQSAQKFILVIRPEDDPGIFDQQHKRKFSEAVALRTSTLADIPRRKRGPIASAIAIHRIWAGVSEDRFRRMSDQVRGNILHADTDEALVLHGVRERFRGESHHLLPLGATAGFAACLEHDRLSGMAFVSTFADAGHQEYGHPARKLFHWIGSRVSKKRDDTSVQSYYNAVVYCYDAYLDRREVQQISTTHERFLTPKGGRT